MSIPERPDENMEWAESPGAEVEEPAAIRPQGWPFAYVPSSAAFNWLQRATGRWVKWLESKVDGHVHDGGNEPESVEKIDPEHHVNWGEYGGLEITSDTSYNHRIKHKATGRSTFESDGFYSTNNITAENIIEGEGLKTKSGDLYSDAGTIKLWHEIQGGPHRANMEAAGGDFDGDVEIDGDVIIEGTYEGNNVPILRAQVSSNGNDYTSWGLDDIEKEGTGTYAVYFNPSIPMIEPGLGDYRLLAIVTAEPGGNDFDEPIMITARTYNNGGTGDHANHTGVLVETYQYEYDEGDQDIIKTKVDCGFNIIVYDHRGLS